MEVRIDGKDIDVSQIELLVHILASQRAATITLLEVLANSDEEATEYVRLYNEHIVTETNSVINELYARRGKLNLGDLFDTP